MVGVVTDKERLIREMDREIKEEKRKDELVALYERQRVLKNELLKKKIIEEGRIDLLATEILGYTLWPFHQTILGFQYGKKRSLVLAPRDSGKSSMCDYTKIIYEILRNPNVRIVLVSKTQLQAEGFLREIKNHFETNTKLKDVFGDLIGKKWDAKEIVIKGRTSKAKESTVTAIGVGSALVGKHFDIIVGDDLVDEENSRTELQRERLRTWFYQSLYKTLEPEGEIHLIGTRYHYLDFWGHVMGDTEYDGAGEFKDHFMRVKALDEDPETGEQISFWPQKFSVEKLLEDKTNMGTIIFNAQMQNDTQAMKGVIFKERWFRYYDEEPVNILKYSGVDLAISTSKKANKFAHVTIGVDLKGNVYILSYFARRGVTPSQQTNIISERGMDEQPLFIAIEANAYQASKAVEVADYNPRLNIKKVFTDIDKKLKGWKAAALAEAGKLYIREDQKAFRDHLLLFTGDDGGDDDLFDAFFNALTIAIYKRVKKERKEPGLI
jgi:hypothetical protein